MKRIRKTTVVMIALVGAAALGLFGPALLGCSGGTASTTQTSAAQPTTQTSAAQPATQTSAAEPATYITVDVQQAFDALDAGSGAQIVDVREPSEWATTGVPVGAALIPLGELELRAPGELAKDKPVYVICNSGNRSRTGSEILLKLGYTEVYNVAGGIQAWLKAGLPVETYQP